MKKPIAIEPKASALVRSGSSPSASGAARSVAVADRVISAIPTSHYQIASNLGRQTIVLQVTGVTDGNGAVAQVTGTGLT
jgi:hypothetical protein